MDELVKYLKAMLAVQLNALMPEPERQKLELLLSRAGVPRKEIAELLNKSEAAVSKTIERARAAASRQPVTMEESNA